MKLKVQKVVTYKVDSNDFDKFVNSIYGGKLEFVADHEASNMSSYEFSAPNCNVDFGGKYEEKIRSGNYNNVPIHAIFNVLHKDGHIESGEYIINVFW